MSSRRTWVLLVFASCLEPLPLDGFTFSCATEADCRAGQRCVQGVCAGTGGGTSGGSAGGSPGGGSAGSTAGGNTSGGSAGGLAGGTTSGGTAGGFAGGLAGGTTSGGTAGGFAGGETSGGTTAGGLAGGTTAGGLAGGVTAGGTTAGGTTSGGTAGGLAGGATAGGSTAGGTTSGGTTSGGTTAGGSAAGGLAGGTAGGTSGGAAGGSTSGGAAAALPLGHCRHDGWCWVNPHPAGGIGATEVRNANTMYVASLDRVYRVVDGGLVDQNLIASRVITDLEFRNSELWAMTDNGPERLTPTPVPASAPSGRLISSSTGSLWVANLTEFYRYNGIGWTTVSRAGTQCPPANSYAAIGNSIFQACGQPPVQTILEEFTMAGLSNTFYPDGGFVLALGGRSAAGFYGLIDFRNGIQLGTISSTTGALTPLVPLSISPSQNFAVSVDETLALAGIEVVELPTGIISPRPFNISAQSFAGSGTLILTAEQGDARLYDITTTLPAPPNVRLTTGPMGSGPGVFASTSRGDWFSCGESITSGSLPNTPPSVTTLVQHPDSREILTASFSTVYSLDGGSWVEMPDGGRDIRLLAPSSDKDWLAAGVTSNVAFTSRWNGTSWQPVTIPFTSSTRRLTGLSSGDAGVYLATSGGLFRWSPTQVWEPVVVPNVNGGEYGNVCVTNTGLILTEQLGSSSRHVLRSTTGAAWSNRSASTSYRLVCREAVAYDLFNGPGTQLTRWLPDGGPTVTTVAFPISNVFKDLDGGEYLVTGNCGLLRRQ